MLVVMGFFDRFLDIIGLVSLIWWCFKGTRYWYTRKQRSAGNV